MRNCSSARAIANTPSDRHWSSSVIFVSGPPAEAIVVADGTSCRQQIEHGAGRAPIHVARLLAEALRKADAR